ncbi:MAG: hypothetical protein H0X34_07160 [Chthoniobacterales bacterium]|nr:hypothetical protein [Chthoniobacterales bacterium]
MFGQYYSGHPMVANSAYHIAGSRMSGFLATVAGTITVTDHEPTDGSNAIIVNALPLAVGFNRIPLLFQSTAGADVQLAGGAAGTLLI